MISKLRKILLEATFWEKEGVGLWYEYLAKCDLYNSIEGDVRTVLVDQMPEKFGLALDYLYWIFEEKRVYVYDSRKSKLREAEKIVGQFELLNSHYLTPTTKNSRKVDLVCNTEVLQNYDDEKMLNYLNKVYKMCNKYALFFIPNGDCYAHPKYSGLKSKKLEDVVDLIKETKFNVRSYGFIDIPPWPSGMSIQSSAKDDRPQGKMVLVKALVNRIASVFFPLLVQLEKYYPSFYKRKQAHMIYVLLKK